MVSLSKITGLNADYIPVISTLTNLKELVSYNFFQIPITKPLNQITLIEKTFFQRVLLLIPVFGNLAIYLFRPTSLTQALDAALAGKKIFGSLNVLEEDLDNEQNLQKVLDLLKQGLKENHAMLYAYLRSLSLSEHPVVNEIKKELFHPKHYELLKLFYLTSSTNLPPFLKDERAEPTLHIPMNPNLYTEIFSEEIYLSRYKTIFLTYYCQSEEGFTYTYFGDYFSAFFCGVELKQISFKLFYYLSLQPTSLQLTSSQQTLLKDRSKEIEFSEEQALSEVLSIKDENLRMKLLYLILCCERRGLRELFFKRVGKEIEWEKKVNLLPCDTLVRFLNHCFPTPAFSMVKKMLEDRLDAKKMLEDRSNQQPDTATEEGNPVKVRYRYRLESDHLEILKKHGEFKDLLEKEDDIERRSRSQDPQHQRNRSPITRYTPINETLQRIQAARGVR